MTEGDVVLTPLPQADGEVKPRPAIWLVCGVSSQAHHEVVGFDDVIESSHADFAGSGLKAASLIRLGFLAILPSTALLGVIGSISPERHGRLLQRLGAFLQSPRSA